MDAGRGRASASGAGGAAGASGANGQKHGMNGSRDEGARRRTSAGASPSDKPAEHVKGTPEQEALMARVRRANDDYYKILGIEKGATDDEIKKAYRKTALKLHPDKCRANGADEAFKRVSAAFATLRNPAQRRMYDWSGGDSSASSSSSSSSTSPFSSSSSSSRPFRGRQFRDQDAEDLYRAFFSEEGGSDDEDFQPTDGSVTALVVAKARGAFALGKRLLKAFKKNPWTLVTLLSGVASVVNVLESLSEALGGHSALVNGAAVLVAGALGAFFCPQKHRPALAVAAVAVVVCLGSSMALL